MPSSSCALSTATLVVARPVFLGPQSPCLAKRCCFLVCTFDGGHRFWLNPSFRVLNRRVWRSGGGFNCAGIRNSFLFVRHECAWLLSTIDKYMDTFRVCFLWADYARSSPQLFVPY